MKKFIKLLAISALVLIGALVVMPSNSANAWTTDQSANAVCKDGYATISWSFKNDHNTGHKLPSTNLEEADMSIIATDTRTGAKYGPYVVHPQETFSEVIETNQIKIGKGELKIDLKWTHFNTPEFRNLQHISSTKTNPDGTKTTIKSTYKQFQVENNLTNAQLEANFNKDSRVASYSATADCRGAHVSTDFNPEIVCEPINGKANYVLNITNKSGANATYTPADGSVMTNGDPVTVTATYSDGYYGTKTVSKTAESTTDCTPDTPIHRCEVASVSRIGDTRQYKINVESVTANGAELTGYTYDFGDGSEKVVTKKDSIKHGYRKNGNYKITVTAAFNVYDEVVSADCAQNIKVAKQDICQRDNSLLANDKDCKAPKPVSLPNTGATSTLLGAFSLGGVASAIRAWATSRKALKESLLS